MGTTTYTINNMSRSTFEERHDIHTVSILTTEGGSSSASTVTATSLTLPPNKKIVVVLQRDPTKGSSYKKGPSTKPSTNKGESHLLFLIP